MFCKSWKARLFSYLDIDCLYMDYIKQKLIGVEFELEFE